MMDDFRIRVGAKMILLFINRETQVDWVIVIIIDMQYHMLRYFRPQFACIIEYLSPLTFSSLGQVNIWVHMSTGDLARCQDPDPLEAGHASGEQLSECQQHKSMSEGLLSFINNCGDTGQRKPGQVLPQSL